MTALSMVVGFAKRSGFPRQQTLSLDDASRHSWSIKENIKIRLRAGWIFYKATPVSPSFLLTFLLLSNDILSPSLNCLTPHNHFYLLHNVRPLQGSR